MIGHISGPEYPSWSHQPEPDTDRRARQREFSTNVLTWLLMIAVCAGAWGLFVWGTTRLIRMAWEG